MAATTVKAGERKPLNVLGMPLTMLCEARETKGAWSLFEEEVPLGMGPPPHRHDWDEAYYILDGAVEFLITASQSNPVAVISITCPVERCTASRVHRNPQRASLFLPLRRTDRNSSRN